MMAVAKTIPKPSEIAIGMVLGLQRLFEDDRREPAGGGQGGEHDRPEAAQPGLVDGVERTRLASAAAAVGEIDHDQRVVDHHAAQRDDTHQADQREVEAEQDVADHGADDLERDGGEDDERLEVAAEGHREQRIDDRQR